jgi:hypothetical protein
MVEDFVFRPTIRLRSSLSLADGHRLAEASLAQFMCNIWWSTTSMQLWTALRVSCPGKEAPLLNDREGRRRRDLERKLQI